jgi:hypothetical protein
VTTLTNSDTLAATSKRSDPAWQAFALLRTVFTIAPILFGLDKFFNLLTDWPSYLAPLATDVLPVTGQQFMYGVGVVEIIAGVVVFVAPRYGAMLVAAWLAGIIVNLLILPGYFDVAVRDFGLFVAALALFRLTFVRSIRSTTKEQV